MTRRTPTRAVPTGRGPAWTTSAGGRGAPGSALPRCVPSNPLPARSRHPCRRFMTVSMGQTVDRPLRPARCQIAHHPRTAAPLPGHTRRCCDNGQETTRDASRTERADPLRAVVQQPVGAAQTTGNLVTPSSVISRTSRIALLRLASGSTTSWRQVTLPQIRRCDLCTGLAPGKSDPVDRHGERAVGDLGRCVDHNHRHSGLELRPSWPTSGRCAFDGLPDAVWRVPTREPSGNGGRASGKVATLAKRHRGRDGGWPAGGGPRGTAEARSTAFRSEAYFAGRRARLQLIAELEHVGELVDTSPRQLAAGRAPRVALHLLADDLEALGGPGGQRFADLAHLSGPAMDGDYPRKSQMGSGPLRAPDPRWAWCRVGLRARASRPGSSRSSRAG